MVKKEKEEIEVAEDGKTFKFLLRLEPDVYERIKQQSLRRLGITATAYMRIAIMTKLEEDEASEAKIRGKHIR